jgi:surfeit locus 1 family protein
LLLVAIAFHHVNQRDTKAGDDCKKCECDKIFHPEDYRLTPTRRFWVVTVACAALAVLGLFLGFWQLNRADFKRTLKSALEQSAQLPPLTNDAFRERQPNVADLHRRVDLIGKWLPEHTLFWDNIPMSGKTGFVVLTPFQLEGTEGIVLVQRGWVLRNFVDRAALPDLENPEGTIRIQGVLSTFPSQRIALGGMESGPIRQNPSYDAYRTKLGSRFASVSVRQTDGPRDNLKRDWAQVEHGIGKHMGYAFQWFSLSALVVIYYLWFQIVKRKSHANNP